MFDQRENKKIFLNSENVLKENATYKYQDEITQKNLVAKMIADYPDESDAFIISEFRKLCTLSGEAEFASVYFLVKSQIDNQDEQTCYLMDFIDGLTLEDYLNKNNSIEVSIALDLIIQFTSGVEKIHNYDLSHNDLHTRNIMFSQTNRLKIIDFLFFDFSNEQVKFDKDISDYKDVVNLIIDKTENNLDIIKPMIDAITNLNGITLKLKNLKDILLEISFLNESVIGILSPLIKEFSVSFNGKYNHIMYDNIDIPEFITNKLSDDNNVQQQLNILISRHIDKKLFSLKVAGLIIYFSSVINKGDDSNGPFAFRIAIQPLPKMLKWLIAYRDIQYLQESEYRLHEIILKE